MWQSQSVPVWSCEDGLSCHGDPRVLEMLRPCKAAGTEWSKEAITPVPENSVTSPDFGGHWGHSYGAQACLQAKHLHT